MSQSALLKIYNQYKELVHIAAFVVLFIFTLGGNWTKWQAFAEDVSDLKSRTTRLELTNAAILQSLEDIKDYLHVPKRRQ